MAITDADKNKLFKKVKHQLGAPLRKVELTNEMYETYLEIAIEEYSEYINEWLTEHQWDALLGKNVNTIDMTWALTTRPFDYENQYTYSYSKQVGLQVNGPYELKKDYVTLVEGQQVYEIPKDREINEILWITPPTMDSALWGYWGLGGGMGMMAGFGFPGSGVMGGGMGMGGGYGGMSMTPAFDVLLRAGDLNLKQRMLASEMIYKITAGPNGVKYLHLLPTPGSKLTFFGASAGLYSLIGCKVWYYYYDTAGMSPEDIAKCKEYNRDIITAPNDVPLENIDYCDLNAQSRNWVRKWFLAECKMALGRVRGKFGGALKVPGAEVTMDYDSLLSEGKEEKTELKERVSAFLEKLTTQAQLERRANEAEQLNKNLSYRAVPYPIIII